MVKKPQRDLLLLLLGPWRSLALALPPEPARARGSERLASDADDGLRALEVDFALLRGGANSVYGAELDEGEATAISRIGLHDLHVGRLLGGEAGLEIVLGGALRDSADEDRVARAARPSLGDAELAVVHGDFGRGEGLVLATLVGEGHEAEAARDEVSAETLLDDLALGDLAILRERLGETLLGRLVVEVADVDLELGCGGHGDKWPDSGRI